ncbi:vWA domain-containing protein [Thermomonospora umbrina]|uniref:Extracellular solute-binding protein n=1 Tax=Thermomonospora umbrina TaxID=111806 RepID=A0A3D9T012_9ACTN|nr:substrate-binding domain-containing protein [Thermomonospora umbrina]REF00141.1 extracellular solute-binding protein [Thermomonospora umbrina]
MADERPRRGRRGRPSGVPTLVVLPLVLMSVWIDQGVIRVHWLIATAVITAAVLFQEFLLLLPEPGPVLRALRRGLRRYGPGVAAMITGAAVVFSGWSLAGWSRTRLSPCPPPAELRVMAAAETLRVVRGQADAFAAERAEGVRCRPVHVTVFRAPPLKPLTDAFVNGWQNDNAERSALATVGPRPDLWLASSRAVAEHATRWGVLGAHREITPAGMVSPVVLAVSKAAGFERADWSPEGWEEAVDRLRREGVTLLRPNPETGDVAVVATTALYGPGLDARERHRLEQELSPPGLTLTDADEMLCEVRERLAAEPAAKIAVIVPEHSLATYARGAPLGGACTRQLAPDETTVQWLDLVRPRPAPLLDYSLVRITWNDERDGERERLAEEFRDWLAGRATRMGRGFGPPGQPSAATPLDARRLAVVREQIAATRRPRTVLFAVDRSGSMKAPVSGGTAIGRARDLVGESLDWLGRNDEAGLWAFPSGRDGRDPSVLADLAPRDRAVPAVRDRLKGSGLAAEGEVTPLHHVVAEGLRRLRGETGDGSLVVLTDGGDDAGPHAGADLAELRDELRSPGAARVHLVVVGERGCDRRLEDLLADAPGSRCLDFGPSSGPRQVAGELFADIWKED